MKKLAAIIDMRTGDTIAAPSHCPFCGVALGDLIRHVLGWSFEVTCEQAGCGKTCIVMNDHVKF